MEINNNSFVKINIKENKNEQVKSKPVKIDLNQPTIKLVSNSDTFTLKTSSDVKNPDPIDFVDDNKISSNYDEKTKTAKINTEINGIKTDSTYNESNKKLDLNIGTDYEDNDIKFKTKVDTTKSTVESLGLENKTGNKLMNADFDPNTKKGSASISTDDDKFKLDSSYDFQQNKLQNIGGTLTAEKGSIKTNFKPTDKVLETELSNIDGNIKLSGSYNTETNSFKNATFDLKEGEISLNTSFEQTGEIDKTNNLKLGVSSGDTKVVGNFNNITDKASLNSVEFSTKVTLGDKIPSTGLNIEYDNKNSQLKKAGVETSFEIGKETSVSLGANLVPNSFENTAKVERKIGEHAKLGIETNYDQKDQNTPFDYKFKLSTGFKF